MLRSKLQSLGYVNEPPIPRRGFSIRGKNWRSEFTTLRHAALMNCEILYKFLDRDIFEVVYWMIFVESATSDGNLGQSGPKFRRE